MKKSNVICLVLIILLIAGCFNYFYYQRNHFGNYIIQRQWISSDDCDECLHIEFYEGCNRYITYFFENEHELNPRFLRGDAININWKKVNGKYYVNGIKKANEYRTKC